jgi:hypothetical protein
MKFSVKIIIALAVLNNIKIRFEVLTAVSMK